MKNLSTTEVTKAQASFFIENLAVAVGNTKNSKQLTGASSPEVNNIVLTLDNDEKFYNKVLELIKTHEDNTGLKWSKLPDTVKGLQIYLTMVEYLENENSYLYNNLEAAYLLSESYDEH